MLASSAETSLWAADCSTLLDEARKLLAADNFAAALAATDQCVAKEPRNSRALLLRGNLLYLTGKDPEALQLLSDLIDREPTNWDARYALARVYYFNDRPEQSIAQYEAILNAQPDHYRAWDNLGLALEGAGKTDEAVKAHIRAIAIVSKDHPEYDWAHANLAELLMKRDENRRAFDLAAEAAQRNPNGARNYFLAGKALTRLNQWPKAERWFVKAAELDPTYPAPHYFLAQLYRKTARPELATKETRIFQQLREMAPEKKR